MTELRRRVILFTTASMVILSLGFAGNVWRAADPGWYHDFQRGAESLVVGRIVKSRADGMVSSGALLGRFEIPGREGATREIQAEAQYDFLVAGAPGSRFNVYRSQNGFQAIGYGVIDRLAPVPASRKVGFFRGLTGVATAAAITAILCWLLLEFGWVTAGAALLTTAAAQWITVYGPHLYFVTWAFYLPLVLALFWLRRGEPASPVKLFVALTVTYLLKCIFTGYEFATTAVLMMLVPLVYYGVLRGWSVARIAKWAVAGAIAAGVATAISVGVLAAQVGAEAGDAGAAAQHLIDKFGVRTYGTPDAFDDAYRQSLEAGVWDTLNEYLNTQVFDFGYAGSVPLHLPLYTTTLVLLALTIAYLVRRRRAGCDVPPATRALIAATWFSILAPLSWILLFKSHSAMHVHQNQIVWHMPFLLFAFAMGAHLLAGMRRRTA